MRIFKLGVMLLFAGAAVGQNGIWISKAKIATLPTTGGPWTFLKSNADTPCVAMNLADLTNTNSQCAAANGLVFAKLGIASYRTTVETQIQTLVNYTNATFLAQGGRCLELSRHMGQYPIAADLIDLKTHNPTLDTAFRAKLVEILTWSTNQDGTIASGCNGKPDDWGAVALHSRIAIDLYVGNTVAGYNGVTDLATAANIFRGYLGDYAAYHGFNWASAEANIRGPAVKSWYQDPWVTVSVSSGAQPTPIAGPGTTLTCQASWNSYSSPPVNLCVPGTVFNLDGRTIDMYRGGHFKLLPITLTGDGCTNPGGGQISGPNNGPCESHYPVTALLGYMASAEMLFQNGYDSYNWSNQAVKRAILFMKRISDTYDSFWFLQFSSSDPLASWTGYLANARYGLSLPVSGNAEAVGNGTMGWTDWTTIGDLPIGGGPAPPTGLTAVVH